MEHNVAHIADSVRVAVAFHEQDEAIITTKWLASTDLVQVVITDGDYNEAKLSFPLNIAHRLYWWLEDILEAAELQ